MRLYELLFITRPDYDEDKVTSVIAKYTDLITKAKGIVKTSEKWGKRHLTYEIDDLRDGIYVLITFEAERNVSFELDRLMKIDQEILRHMISRIEPSKRRIPEKEAVGAKAEEPKATPGESAPTVRIVKESPSTQSTSEDPSEPKVGETTIQE